MADLLINLNCPSCGGALKIEEGDSLILCPYCHTASTTGSQEGISTLMYAFRVQKEDAVRRVREWFASGSLFLKKAADLKDSGEISESVLIYLPFWRMTGRGRAVVCGYNKHQVKNKTNYEYKEADVSRTYSWNGIACDAGEIGVLNIPSPAGEVVPVDEEEIPVFETTDSVHDGMERATCGIRDLVYGDASAGISNITYAKTFVTPNSFGRFLYPFWIVRYQYRARGYFAVVDAISGEIRAGRAPGDPGRQVSAGSVGATIAGVFLGLLIVFALAIAPGLSDTPAIVLLIPPFILLVLTYLVAGYSYRTFRYGSEIVEGDLPGGGN